MSSTQVAKKAPNLSLDDGELVKRCQQGDSSAMDTLIIKYQDRIYNIIRNICSNSDDAAELTQDTFVKAIEKLSDFKGNSSFYTWVFRIAVNLTLNFNKRRAKIGFKSLEDAVGGADKDSRASLKNYLFDKSDSDPVIVAQNNEVALILNSALNKLDEEHKTIVLLREVESMSYIEIAEVLEIELGTVKSRLYRARESLRDMLKEVLS